MRTLTDIDWLLILVAGTISVFYNLGILYSDPVFSNLIGFSFWRYALSSFMTIVLLLLVANILIVMGSKVFSKKKVTKDE